MNGQNRTDIQAGMQVEVVLKKDQRTGVLTRGHVKRILTKSQNHPHGIKVMLEDGQMKRILKSSTAVKWLAAGRRGMNG